LKFAFGTVGIFAVTPFWPGTHSGSVKWGIVAGFRGVCAHAGSDNNKLANARPKRNFVNKVLRCGVVIVLLPAFLDRTGLAS
jgi:hypothetical protein